MRALRLLVVDDSAIARSVIAEIFRKNELVNVVGFCSDGTQVPKAIAELQPDVITLDVEMPHLSGPSVLKHVLHASPIPVIMVSGKTDRGAKITVECLALGAVDFVLKPSTVQGQSVDAYAEQLLSKVTQVGHAALQHKALRTSEPSKSASNISELGNVTRTVQQPYRLADSRSGIIAIGASTGGPRVVASILGALERPCPPIVIVIHMPMPFTQLYAERLGRMSKHTSGAIAVHHVQHQQKLLRNHAYIAPGDQHLTIEHTTQGSPIALLHAHTSSDIYKPSIDKLLYSVAKSFGANALACILTGMGRDGLIGARCIIKHGGTVFTQDEPTSAIYGMPKAVHDAGLAHKSLSSEAFASAISEHYFQHHNSDTPTANL